MYRYVKLVRMRSDGLNDSLLNQFITCCRRFIEPGEVVLVGRDGTGHDGGGGVVFLGALTERIVGPSGWLVDTGVKAGDVVPVSAASRMNQISVVAFERGAGKRCLCSGGPAKDQSQTGDSCAPTGARDVFHGKCSLLRVANNFCGADLQPDAGKSPSISPQYLIGRHPRTGWRPDYSGRRFLAGRSGQGSTKPGVIAGSAPEVLLGNPRIYAS